MQGSVLRVWRKECIFPIILVFPAIRDYNKEVLPYNV